MALEKLTICRWHSTSRDDVDVSNPSWIDVEKAVRRLDGEQYNDLYLKPFGTDDRTFLCVGGGGGKYVVAGTDAGGRNVAVPAEGVSDDSLVSLLVGGQLGEFPSRYILALDRVLSATRAFFDAGGFECLVQWEYT
jgi:hypothetical protein